MNFTHHISLEYNSAVKHTKNIRGKACHLRSKGKTYSEIKKILGINIPKSTLSYWCSHICLPEWFEKKVAHLNKMNLTKAQKIAWYVHKRNRKNLLKSISEKNTYLIKKMRDKDILKMLLSFLYLGEGSKWRSHRGLSLGNSDPLIIKLYMRLLNLCYGIKSSQFKARICYRADQNLHILHKYWSKITSIPLKNFYLSQPDSRTIGKPTKRKDYKGVCALTCPGTNIQLELESIPAIIFKGM